MLLHSYKIARILPGPADPEKIRGSQRYRMKFAGGFPLGSDGRENLQQLVRLNK